MLKDELIAAGIPEAAVLSASARGVSLAQVGEVWDVIVKYAPDLKSLFVDLLSGISAFKTAPSPFQLVQLFTLVQKHLPSVESMVMELIAVFRHPEAVAA